MSVPLKVVALGLEEVVLAAREEGLSLERIRDRCNETLKGAGETATVSKPAIERYLRSLDKASVAPAHQPQLAQRNAELSIDFAGRMNALDEKLGRWIEEVDAAVTPMRGVLWDPYAQTPLPTKEAQDRHRDELDRLGDALDYMSGDQAEQMKNWIAPVDVFVPDWQARVKVAGELRKLLEVYADVMGRIHDAQQVADFQSSVHDAIAEASPEVAQAVVAKMRAKRDARKAALLGAAA